MIAFPSRLLATPSQSSGLLESILSCSSSFLIVVNGLTSLLFCGFNMGTEVILLKLVYS